MTAELPPAAAAGGWSPRLPIRASRRTFVGFVRLGQAFKVAGFLGMLAWLATGRATWLDAALRTAVDPAGPDPDPRLALLAGVRSAPSRIRCATLAWDALATALGR